MTESETGPVRFVEVAALRRAPVDEMGFLRHLGRPTVVAVPGRDRSRVRVVAGGIHGNEPSGWRALLRLVHSSLVPATDLLLFFGGVEASLAHPSLSHRFVPGRRDLNRCFLGPFDDHNGRVAAAALALLTQRRPEAVIDLHNNTGKNPDYVISRATDARRLAIASLFSPRVVDSRIRLGAFFEAMDAVAPALTVECGQAFTTEADDVAWRGLCRFALCAELPEAPALQPEILTGLVRVRLVDGVDIVFSDALPASGTPLLAVAAGLEQLNFQHLPGGQALGRLAPDTPWPVVAIDENGQDIARELFVVEAGVLRVRRPLVPMMISPSVAVARADCLFYASLKVEAAGPDVAGAAGGTPPLP